MREKAAINLTGMPVEPCMLKPQLTLDEIPSLNIAEATQILCSVLSCYKLLDCIKELSGKWRLVAASCIYWYRKAKPPLPYYLVEALVQCLVVCHDPLCTTTEAHSHEFVQGEEYLKALHTFAQWQCTYCDAVKLNQLLQEPFPYTSPAYLYSGKVAMHCASLCLQSRPYQFSPDQSKLFDSLMELIILGSKDGTIVAVHKKRKATLGPGVTQAGAFIHQNRFELLQKLKEEKEVRQQN